MLYPFYDYFGFNSGSTSGSGLGGGSGPGSNFNLPPGGHNNIDPAHITVNQNNEEYQNTINFGPSVQSRIDYAQWYGLPTPPHPNQYIKVSFTWSDQLQCFYYETIRLPEIKN